MEYLVIDTETTAKEPHLGHLAEIGAVLLDSVTFEMKDVFHHKIKESEDFDRNAWIFSNSNLTAEDILKEGVSLESVREELQNLFDKYVVIAFNGFFDFKWLENRKFSIPRKGKDPMYITTNILKLPPRIRGTEYKWPSVQECLRYFKIDAIEPHRALEDARLEARIIIELIKLRKYEYSEAKAAADTNDLKVTRYQTKIDFLNKVKSSIENLRTALMRKEELELESQKVHTKEHLVRTESLKESADHLISHIDEKIAVCEKMSGKLNVKS